MKKKKALYVAALVMGISIVSGGTLAYFTADETAHNVITTNMVEIEVVDQTLKNGTLEDDTDNPIRIMPAMTVSKVMAVKCIEAEAWVRMNYELTVLDASGKEMTIPADELEKTIVIEPNENDWKFEDGWWYYKSAVKAGETTAPLFREIEFSGPEMGNEYQNGTVEVDVIAQAVQKANNGSSVMDAAGWPE